TRVPPGTPVPSYVLPRGVPFSIVHPARTGSTEPIDKIFLYVQDCFPMREVLYLEQVEQAEALLKPQRIDVLRQLAEPRSCSEVAARLDQTPQRVYYHVKRLVEAGLATQVSERRVRGIVEGIYQASAQSYWLSPRLVGRIGLRQARDELSLGYLLDL